GVELGASRRFGLLDASVNYTWQKTVDDATGQQLIRRPKHSGSIALGYDAQPISAQLVVTHSGRRRDVTDLLPFGVVVNEAYTTADVTLKYAAGATQPFMKIENATDVQYDEVFGYPSARRRVIVGVRYTVR
ncbi:MAG: TonB-dependent receptor domain-containing protein, partial [Thermoanaerobaculia bacterium]